MQTLLTSTALAVVLSVASMARADVITFNELAAPGTPILGTVLCAGTTGFRFSSSHFHVVDGNTTDPKSSNGTSHIGYEAGRGFPILMERVEGRPFSLLSLDGGEFYGPASPDRPDATQIQMVGTRADGSHVIHTVDLDGISDGPGGQTDYQHFVLPSTFVDLVSVVFTGLRPGSTDAGMALDNLEYSVGAPETLPACVMTVQENTPTVSIDAPLPGTVSGTISIATTASAAVSGMRFSVDGVTLDAIDTTAPFAANWSTASVADGPHTITVDALDAGNAVVATASVVVTVQNTPVNTGNPHYLTFDGLDDAVTAPDHDAISFGTGTADRPLTIELWFRPDVMGRSQLLGKWGESSNQEYRLHIVSNYLRFDLRDESARASAWVISQNGYALAGTWHHLAVAYDGRGGPLAANGIAMYLDGQPIPLVANNNAAYVAMENLAAPLQIGRQGPSWIQYPGGLDEIRLWNVQRSVGQIQAALATELNGAEPGLVGYWRFNEGAGLTAGNDAVSRQAALLVNGTQWATGGPLAPHATDTTPPLIGNVATGGTTANRATITFETDEPTTAVVAYSATGSCPCTTVTSPTTGTTHSVALTGLAPNTTYTFTVRATDAAGNAATTPPFLLTTPALVDVTPPAVTLTSPAAGTAVAGSVMLQATASDDAGVASVLFKVDGMTVGAPLSLPPYAVAWNTTTVANGTHTVSVEARDLANNLSSAAIVVTVQNASPTGNPYYLAFDGVDDAVVVPDNDAISFGTSTADRPITIELWFRPDVMGRSQLIGKWGESNNQEYRLHIVSGFFRFDLRDESARASAYVLTQNAYALAGTWHHLAVTYDGRGGPLAANGIAMYLDGQPIALVANNNAAYVAMENLAAPLQIGRQGPSWIQYPGGLDEIRLWTVQRSASQIQGVMNAELTGSEPGLVGYWRFSEGAGLTTGDGAASHQVANLVNGTQWASGGPLAPRNADITPPVIGSVVTSGTTATGTHVSFQTDEPTSASVAYSATGACPCTTVVSPATGTSHNVALTGLASSTTYTFTVRATDAAGNAATTAPFLVTTPALVDTTPPTVTLTWPASGTTVAGTVTMQATATDNIGVATVLFRVDGVAVGAALTVGPYVATWNTMAAANGTHTVSIEARDVANNSSAVSVVVTVQNAPPSGNPNYLTFDGVDDAAVVPDHDAISFGTGTADRPLTVELWFRPDVMGRSQLLGKWGESSNQEYRLHIVSGWFRFDLRDESARASAYVLTQHAYALAGTWHHLAVTYDGRGGATAADGIAMYLDGQPIPLVANNNPAYVAMENLVAPLQIGRQGPSWIQYGGGLDEIRLWAVQRTVGQIQAAMTTELSVTEPGLVGYWQFNEGTGTTTGNGAASGVGGTLVNGTQWAAGGPLAAR